MTIIIIITIQMHLFINDNNIHTITHIYKGVYYKHITHYQAYSLDRMALELALIRVKFNLP